MRLPLYQIDAFADAVFKGNPAGVVPLEAWLADELMQAIAAENNLSETAFFIRQGDEYGLRWFTPAVEVDLCGHATLATAFLIFTRLDPERGRVRFHTRSGVLEVLRVGERLEMDFPARPPKPCAVPAGLVEALGTKPQEVLESRDLLVAFQSQEKVAALAPDFGALKRLGRAVIATAPGSGCDFVSRFFAPNFGIDEDPVTGSAHSTLIPYWSQRLGKVDLFARQISQRVGTLYCSDRGDRVGIAGDAVLYLEGTIHV